MKFPLMHHPFDIEMDASDYALRVVITQSSHPVSLHSETFNNTFRRYSTYEKDLYAIAQVIKKWKHYILGKEMVILTDHNPLQFAPSQ